MLPARTHTILLSIIFTTLLLPGCDNTFNPDAAEEQMEKACKCEGFYNYSDGLFIEEKQAWIQACARKMGDSLKYGFVLGNKECTEFLPFIYDDAKGFSDGLAPVRRHGKWGMIDTTGKVVIDYKFETLETFSDSMAEFKADGYSGFINIKGEIIIPAGFYAVTAFWANVSFVCNNALEWKIINTSGETLPVKIDSLAPNYHHENRMLSIGKGKSGDTEYLDYPFYSNGKLVKIYVAENKYTIIPAEKEFDFTILTDSTKRDESIKNIFP